MVVTRPFETRSKSVSGAGSQGRPALSGTIDKMRPDELEARIREILHNKVAALFWAQLPDMFMSIKTTMVE